MKALTLWQPWASLIAYGVKTYETRSWTTSYRGPLAIHASKRFDGPEQRLCWHPSFAQVLIGNGIHKPGELPLGAVLCIVDLIDVVTTESLRGKLSQAEEDFGDYSGGRFAWKLELVKVFNEPIKVGGKQGLWDWDRPS